MFHLLSDVNVVSLVGAVREPPLQNCHLGSIFSIPEIFAL